MKYANIKFDGRSGRQTIGDNIQLIAIDHLYAKMGIPQSEIVYIDKNDLSTYDGEEVILPFSWALVDYIEDGWANRFSSKITPVFLGLNLARDWLYAAEIPFFRRCEPVGCRDERTYRTMTANGIRAYLAGCITLTLPQREYVPSGDGKIFIVDVSEDTIRKLPEGITRDAVIMSHMVEGVTDPKQVMTDRYEQYKREASLVVTSLLHCSVPCIAAGIPVVCIKELVSYRFGWIDKLMRIYHPDEIALIDWNPKPLDVSSISAKMTRVAIERIKRPGTAVRELDELTSYWLDRPKRDYDIDCFLPYVQYLKAHFPNPMTEFDYSIWGLTQMAEMLQKYIQFHYPNARLVNVYDKYRRLNFFGRCSCPPENVGSLSGCVFVTTIGAENDAKNLIRTGQLSPDRVCLFHHYK